VLALALVGGKQAVDLAEDQAGLDGDGGAVALWV
jgi:hypothetical protein